MRLLTVNALGRFGRNPLEEDFLCEEELAQPSPPD